MTASVGVVVALVAMVVLTVWPVWGQASATSRLLASPSPSQYPQTGVLTAADGAAGDQFGSEVAISGTTMVVGAPYHGSGQGAVYVYSYRAGTWTKVAELAATGTVNLGLAVAVSGATIVAGAPGTDVGSDSGAGELVVFSSASGTWKQAATLTAADASANAGLGHDVVISAGTIAATSDEGALYVFGNGSGSWRQTGEPTIPTTTCPTDNSCLSGPVAFVGSQIVAGANRADYVKSNNTAKGALFVFGNGSGTWQLSAQINANDDSSGLGESVAATGNTIAAGAGAAGNGTQSGAVYVFTGSGSSWTQTAELTPSVTTGTNEGRDLFGLSVAIGANTIAASASALYPAPAVFVYSDSGGPWTQTDMLTASAPSGITSSGQTGIGYSEAISGGQIATGGPYSKVGSNASQGAVYLFGPASVLSVTDIAANPAQRSVDVRVTLNDGSTDASGCDPHATYDFTDDELASTKQVSPCVYRLTFDQPGTGIYHVRLQATTQSGTVVPLTVDQYGETVDDSKFTLIIDGCPDPSSDEAGIDSLTDEQDIVCAVTVGAWDKDAGDLASEVISRDEHSRSLVLTPVSVDAVDPGDWQERSLSLVAKGESTGWVPTGTDQAPEVYDSGHEFRAGGAVRDTVALADGVRVPGAPHSWLGAGDEPLSKAELNDAPPARVISAHGYWYTVDGVVRVPAGDEVVTYVPIGTTMSNALGLRVDTGNVHGDDFRYRHVYLAGTLMPDYGFLPLDEKHGKSVFTPREPTTLNELLRPHEGDVWISACGSLAIPHGATIAQALAKLPIREPGNDGVHGFARGELARLKFGGFLKATNIG